MAYASTGGMSTDDALAADQTYGPVRVYVLNQNIAKDDDFWEAAMCAHAEGEETHSANRALGETSAELRK